MTTPSDFNPRSPHGERRFLSKIRQESTDFNPRSPHGERPLPPPESAQCVPISIHAPRTGSDAFPCLAARAYSNFNPRSPHGERHILPPPISKSKSNFNPRSPHGERPKSSLSASTICAFQSTLPARGATALSTASRGRLIFQSTLPARGATAERLRHHGNQGISIHAPRTGSDQVVPCG